MKAVNLTDGIALNRREGDESNRPRPTAFGTALLFVRSISPFFIPETNQVNVEVDALPVVGQYDRLIAPNVPENVPHNTLAFIQQTSSHAHVASLLLGLPAEVSTLVAGVATLANVGLLVGELSRYVSVAQRAAAVENLERLPEAENAQESEAENDDENRTERGDERRSDERRGGAAAL